VGIYESQIVPRVTNVLLGNKEFGKVRAEECEGLSGDVVEIGFGSGLNVPYLPKEVTGLWAVDPSGTAMKLAAKRIAATTIPVHSAGLDGAHLDLADDRFDCALSTMTLCTIPDVTSALDEVRRVLKPGGAYHFAEHGLSPDAKVARFQERFNPWQMRFAGGCHLNREIADLIHEAKFDIEKVRNFYLKGPKGMGYMTLGIARKQ
jgi:ubiquinone/menaquinone biosynthesis C-methylase UbiE